MACECDWIFTFGVASQASSDAPEGEIEVKLTQTGETAELTVRDTGVGIPAEELPRIFERFHRVRDQRGRTHEGSGIGLALVQELVNLHRGTVRVESTLGKGSTFIVSMPLGEAHLNPEHVARGAGLARTRTGAQAFVEEALRWLPGTADRVDEDPGLAALRASASHVASDQRPPDDRPKARILWADDNADMREYVARLLSERFEVVSAPDGQVALETARAMLDEGRPPEFILSDVMMPRLDGLGLVRELRADPQLASIPIMLLSARAGEEARIEGFAAGAEDYLTKPFSARELLARVDAQIRVAAVRREADRAIRESQERLRLFIENAPAAIAMFDRDMRYLAVSRRWQSDYRLAGDLVGLSHYETLPEVPVSWRDAHQRALAGEALHSDGDWFDRTDGPGQWVKWDLLPWRTASGQIGGIIIATEDITDKKRTEEHEHLLMREVNHRSKNMLGLIQAIARQTASASPNDFIKHFEQRVQALADNQDVLVKSGWRNVAIESLVRAQLGYLGELFEERIRLSGPPLQLTAAAAQAIGIALHELATNAVKYGALSNQGGIVSISWRLTNDSSEPRFFMSWAETGGPPVAKPRQHGFGSTVTGRMTKWSLDGQVETTFASEGLVWSLSCPASKVVENIAAARQHATSEPPPGATPALRRILVVEDDFFLADDLAQEFEQAGFEVLGPAGTVADALSLIERTDCAAAVLDVNLGKETSELIALRLAGSSKPFVVISGYSRDQLPPAYNGAPLVNKPLKAAFVVDSVIRCLEVVR